MAPDNDICAYLRNARGCVEDGSFAAKILDALIEEVCNEMNTADTGGGSNNPPPNPPPSPPPSGGTND